MRVLIFGASITQGFWDTEGGWGQRLRTYYDTLHVKDFKKEQPTIFNLGISSDTTKGLLKRFENETAARKSSSEELAFIFSIGTNNAAIDSSGKQLSNPEEYKKDLEILIEKARKYSGKIMFVGLPSCDEKRTTPVFWQDINYINDRIFEFEKIMRGVCEEQKLTHVPIFESFQEHSAHGDELFADGLHPNNDGHALICRLVRPELDKLLTT